MIKRESESGFTYENAPWPRCPRDRVELPKTAQNKLTADRSTTELRWITQLKMRVDIFAHDPLEATNNPRICLQKGAYGLAATIFKYNESVVFNISRVGCLRWQRSSWACPHGEERGEKHGDYR